MKQGILYINYSKNAEPIADENMLSTIIKQYKIVYNTQQNKQFNVSNGLVFIGVQLLCLRGEIIAEKIIFMKDGFELKMRYDTVGSSNINIPLWCDELPDFANRWLNEILGI